ncbi:hypothetical protein AB5J49_31010 [Streptomyces sp. R28]|uniref:Uncharacterized protein n=1 Tax=Streptomyces sp. R28 TaxID=3238628 RepID=A0AB39Q756_9ACTN
MQEQVLSPLGFLRRKIANLENNLAGYGLGQAKALEKAPAGRYCSESPAVFVNDLRKGHKTYISSKEAGWPDCYAKTVNGQALCGKSPAA